MQFHVRDDTGNHEFTVQVRATSKVPQAMLEALAQTLEVRAVGQRPEAELAFWRERPMPLDPARAEVQLQLLPADAKADPALWTWHWPDLFRIARPGVIGLHPDALGIQPTPGRNRPKDNEVGVVRQALGDTPHTVRGRLLCDGDPARFLGVRLANERGRTDGNGRFEITANFAAVPGSVFIEYEAQVPVGAGATPTMRMQIFDDLHDTRGDRVDQDPLTTDDVSDYGDVVVPSTDCILWRSGVTSLTEYFGLMGAPPPAGQLRVKRWSAVFISAGAAPHAFYDYIVAPTDLATARRPWTFFHEFGHTLRHAADGEHSHWDWDNFRFIYARRHDGALITNKGFAFNEGWANYWASVVDGGGVPIHADAPPNPAFMDFNQDRIAERLMVLSGPVGHAFMMGVLIANPGVIHTLEHFEQRYCGMVGAASNPFCLDGAPRRVAATCPPGYNNDGATCRLINIVSKPSATRGPGRPMTACDGGREYDAGLCYPTCPAGMDGNGPFCTSRCPTGYHDDGLTCRRDAWIFGSDHSACPWYDVCGVALARGCSVCPAGFHNDGCTCRRDVDIITKQVQTRAVGTPPSGCRAGLEQNGWLCYPPCPAGMNGVGPICWGRCPRGFDDHGATCYREPNVFSRDPIIPP